jgi:hypothetical protein
MFLSILAAWKVLDDARFLCDKAAVLSNTIKGTPCRCPDVESCVHTHMYKGQSGSNASYFLFLVAYMFNV